MTAVNLGECPTLASLKKSPSGDYMVGDVVEVLVYPTDDWRAGTEWLTGVVVEADRHSACLKVSADGKSYWASLACVRRLKTPADSPDQTAKQDIGKVDWGLLFPHVRKALEAVVAVRAYGESKYGTSESWKTVEPIRYKKAAMRHLIESLGGATTNEKDGGCQHLAQAVCDLLFALEIELKEEK